VLLQVRREIIGFQWVPARGDCTTYASVSAGPGGGPVLAQTVDLNGNLDDVIAVLDLTLTGRPRGARRVLVLSFGGLLGYLGVNSDGLAIGLNLVLGAPGAGTAAVPGHPAPAGQRRLGGRGAGSPARAAAGQLAVPDAVRRDLGGVRRDPGRRGAAGGRQEAVHTNHFLDPGFAAADALNVFARNSSVARLRAGEAGLAGFAAAARAGAAAGVEEHFGLLARPPVCVADTGDIRRERTVAAVVLLPDRGELHLRPGDPSRNATVTFGLRAGAAAGVRP